MIELRLSGYEIQWLTFYRPPEVLNLNKVVKPYARLSTIHG